MRKIPYKDMFEMVKSVTPQVFHLSPSSCNIGVTIIHNLVPEGQTQLYIASPHIKDNLTTAAAQWHMNPFRFSHSLPTAVAQNPGECVFQGLA